MEKQERFISLRLDHGLIGDLRKLSEKLSLGRSATVRLALNELVAKHIRPGHQGEVTVLETKVLNMILTNLGNRIHELENPDGTVGDRVRKAGTKFAWLEDKKKQS